MNQANSYGGESGGGETPPAEKAPETPPAEKAPEIDDNGYKVIPKEDVPPIIPPKEDPPKEDPPKEVPSHSGYSKDGDPPKQDPPKQGDEVPPNQSGDQSSVDVVLKDTDGLLPEEVTSLQNFVKDNKIDEKLAQALVENKKAEVKQYEDSVNDAKAQAQEKKVTRRKEWKEELKSDPDFGGEKFLHNAKRVDKVIDDYMPNLKKVLTDGDIMLPPYVMKDLAKMADHFYSTEKLTQGDPFTPNQSKEDKENDPLDFYNS